MSCCHNCEERHKGCHASCERRKREIEEEQLKKAVIKAARNAEDITLGYVIGQVERQNEWDKKHKRHKL